MKIFFEEEGRRALSGYENGPMSWDATLAHFVLMQAVALLLDDEIDEDAGGLHVLGSDAAGGDDFLRLDDDHIGCGGHHRAEVLAGAFVDQVAAFVADVGANDGDIGADGLLKQVFLAVDGDFLFAFLDDGAKAGLGQHATETCTSGADLLGQGALGLKRDVELASVHLVDGVVVGADMGGNQVLDLVVGDELADAHFGIGSVVADDGEVFNAFSHQCVNQGNGVADSEETADHNGHTVVDFVGSLLYRNEFVHNYLFYFN